MVWKLIRGQAKLSEPALSDLFHESLSYYDVSRVWLEMIKAKQHTYLVLTKWADVAADRLQRLISDFGPQSHIWTGFSAENQEWLNRRWKWARKWPTNGKLFISLEPLLGHVDLTRCLHNKPAWAETCSQYREAARIDWVIAGGESGPGGRPTHPDWVRCIRDQCLKARVPFFFKQWGDWLPGDQVDADGSKPKAGKNGARWCILDRAGNGDASESGEIYVYRVGKRRAGRLLDGRTWDEFPKPN